VLLRFLENPYGDWIFVPCGIAKTPCICPLKAGFDVKPQKMIFLQISG
jgi:hypothetical protein